MNEGSENPYLAPTSDPLPEAPSSGHYPLATLGQRLLGSIIDGLTVYPVITGLNWAISHFTKGEVNMKLIGDPYLVYGLQLLPSLLLFLILNGWLLAKRGQTIGKLLMRIKIVTIHGEKPHFLKLLWVRSFFPEMLYTIPLAGSYIALVDVLFIFRDDRRCLHDWLAGTKVVKVDPEPIPDPRPIRSGYTNVDVENPVPTLAGIFWRRLDIDVKRLPMHAAFLEDLEIAKSDLDPALQELCRAFPTKNPDEIKSARTLAELLEVLKIEPGNLGKLTR